MMQELSDKQIETQDVLQHGVFELVSSIITNAGLPEPEWDMEWIGELSDAVADTVCRITDLTEMDIYPYIEEES